MRQSDIRNSSLPLPLIFNILTNILGDIGSIYWAILGQYIGQYWVNILGNMLGQYFRMSDKTFEFDKRLGLPAHFLIIGASLSGKTTMVLRMLKDAAKLFTPVPRLVLFYYAQYQEQYGKTQQHLAQMGIRMELHRGSDVDLEDLSNIVPKNEQTLLIIDDATQASSTSKNLADVAMNG